MRLSIVFVHIEAQANGQVCKAHAGTTYMSHEVELRRKHIQLKDDLPTALISLLSTTDDKRNKKHGK